MSINQNNSTYFPGGQGINSGVHCEVSNCVYNNKNNGCNALVIDVRHDGQANHTDSSVTRCSTFKSADYQ